jgi:peptidoglycan/LPS O-acetylase OafA/YrhL
MHCITANCAAQSRRAWWFAAVLGAVASVLWWLALRSSEVGGRLAGVFGVAAEDYRQGQDAGAFTVSGGESPVRLEAEAAVENSWIALDMRVVDAAGRTVSRSRMSLSYYHGISQGRPWVTGSRESAELVELQPGDYRLVVYGDAGGGSSSASDFERFGRPVRVIVRAGAGGFRWLIGLACGTSLAAIALALRLLSRQDQARGDRAPAASAMRRAERFVMIDGLRGVAALAVVFCHIMVPEICHFSKAVASALPPSVPSLLRHGDLGVEVFFVLSGFVIAHSVRGRQLTFAFAGRFALRRAVRLDPPYYIAILISIALWAYFLPLGLRRVFDDVGGTPGMLANMIYAQDLLGFVSPVPIAWTLCLEVQFYLAYIGLVWLSQSVGARLRRPGINKQDSSETPALARVLVFWPLLVLSLCLWYPRLHRFDFFGAWFRFFLGVTVYWVFIGQLSRGWLVAFAAALLVLAASFWDTRGLTALATGLLIDWAGRAGGLPTWLSSRWIQFLGRISYSLYLVHIPLGIGFANILWSCAHQSTQVALACAVAAVTASLTASWLMYRIFEGPSIVVSRRITY